MTTHRASAVGKVGAVDLRDIRRLAITAVFSDDHLSELLVLKGGNALDLVYQIGKRSSLDVDLSLEEDFSDAKIAGERLIRALRDRFDSAGYVVFDARFQPRPATDRKTGTRRWGGYELTFKITTNEQVRSIKDVERLRREAHVVGPKHDRTFRIQISKYEYCREKQAVTMDDYTLYVYTPAMIAIEKLRAVCQQMEEYRGKSTRTPRARDFYDIYSVVTDERIDLRSDEHRDLLRNIFEAKDVPLGLLRLIGAGREFHRQDWPAVQAAVAGEIGEFDFYFDFVVGLANDL